MKNIHSGNVFSGRIRKARIQAGITQAEAARKLGVTAVTLNRYEKGHRVPPIELVNNVAVLCGVSAGWLLTGEGPILEVPTTSREQELFGMEQRDNKLIDQSIKEMENEIKRDYGIGNYLIATPVAESAPRESIPIEEALGMTEQVLQSNTTYGWTMWQNIRSFHKAVNVEERLASMERKLDDLLSVTKERGVYE